MLASLVPTTLHHIIGAYDLSHSQDLTSPSKRGDVESNIQDMIFDNGVWNDIHLEVNRAYLLCELIKK